MRALNGDRSQTAMIIFEIVNDAAERGEPCPDNPTLIAATGHLSTSAGTIALQDLHDRGLIKLERFSDCRVVTIIATGKRTAGGNGAPKRTRPRIDDSKLGPRVSRDPCPRCGVRADIGCQHAPITRLSTRIAA